MPTGTAYRHHGGLVWLHPLYTKSGGSLSNSSWGTWAMASPQRRVPAHCLRPRSPTVVCGTRGAWGESFNCWRLAPFFLPRQARPVQAGHGEVRHDMAGVARNVLAGRREAWTGLAGKAGPGLALSGKAWQGRHGGASRSVSRYGMAWQTRLGMACPGRAGRGPVWRGRQGI
jgi:hypothetical protein